MREFITKKIMDKIVQDVLRKADIIINPSDGLKPIDINAIVEFAYELEIQSKSISEQCEGANVLAAIAPDKKTIYFNSDVDKLINSNIGLRNFSLAHELGHWVLHVDNTDRDSKEFWPVEKPFYCRATIAEFDNGFSNSKRKKEEIQADMFAAQLLMPTAMIIGHFNRIRSVRKIEWSDLYEAQKVLEVSVSALKNRLCDLDIIYVRDKQIYASSAEFHGQLTLM